MPKEPKKEVHEVYAYTNCDKNEIMKRKLFWRPFTNSMTPFECDIEFAAEMHELPTFSKFDEGGGFMIYRYVETQNVDRTVKNIRAGYKKFGVLNYDFLTTDKLLKVAFNPLTRSALRLPLQCTSIKTKDGIIINFGQQWCDDEEPEQLQGIGRKFIITNN